MINSPALPSRLEAVSGIHAFERLSTATRTALSEVASLRLYRKDMFIFIEGEDAEFFCFLTSGAVRAYKTTLLGTEQTLHIIRPGEVFAVTGFVVGGSYPATALALEPSVVGFVRNDALRRLVQTHADLAWVLLEMFGERLVDSQQHVAALSGRDTSAKLAGALLQLAQDGSEEKSGAIHLGMRLTHRELAQLIGCSRETVTRTLRDFRDEGSVDVDDAGRLVLYRQALERHANQSA